MKDERTVRELEQACEDAETDYELLSSDYKDLLRDIEIRDNRITELKIEIAGKEAVIKELEKDVAFYKRYQTEKYAQQENTYHSKDWKEQMIQDQGLDNETI